MSNHYNDPAFMNPIAIIALVVGCVVIASLFISLVLWAVT